MKLSPRLLLIITSVMLVVFASGCSGREGSQIIDAGKISKYKRPANVVVVDMQKPDDYAAGHIKDSVNIPLSDIVVNTPVDNMLAPKEQIEKVLGENGISNDSVVLVYDNANNMEAARFWWTLMVYGHENVKVISGGLNALKAAGEELTADIPQINAASFTAKEANEDMIAIKDQVKNQVLEPQENVILLDTRTPEEYAQGAIPGSVLMNYLDNNYNNGTYKASQAIKYQYANNGITKDKTVIMYCKTSVRAAQTYLALYDAGYRNMKVYDGAWLEWSSDSSLPVQSPSGSDNNEEPGNNAQPPNKVVPSNKDNS